MTDIDIDQLNPYIEKAEDNLRQKILEIAKFCKAILIKIDSKLPPNPMRTAYVDLATIFLMGYDRSKLAERVIVKTHPFWNMMCDKNESFFINEADNIFNEIPGDTKMFSEIFKSNTLTNTDKDKLWAVFNDLIPLCVIYIHEKRQPIKKEMNGKMVGTYQAKYHNEIVLKSWVTKYKLKLRF